MNDNLILELELVKKDFTNENGEVIEYNQLIYRYDDEEITIPIKKTIAQMIRICESK